MENQSGGWPPMEGAEEWGEVLSQSQLPTSLYMVWNISPPLTSHFTLTLGQGMAKTHFFRNLRYRSLKFLFLMSPGWVGPAYTFLFFFSSLSIFFCLLYSLLLFNWCMNSRVRVQKTSPCLLESLTFCLLP